MLLPQRDVLKAEIIQMKAVVSLCIQLHLQMREKVFTEASGDIFEIFQCNSEEH